MARKLIYGNEILGFTPAVGVITAKGYVPNSKLLLVNNATSNETLFNFSDPDTLATCSYDPVEHQTTIDINYNLSTVKGNELNTIMLAMSGSDELQIYYEKEEVAIEASQTLVDPVSKLRVSNPESLIDTDFEYGIQQTKWETLKLTNNIPTSYSLAAVTNTGLAIRTANVPAGSDVVTVVTEEPHNLIPGSVVEVIGLTDSIFEGTYIVKTAPDENTFTYKIRFIADSTQNLFTIYGLVYPGSFYTGSGVNIVDITTNTATASTLSVETLTKHGFADNTKLYLKKSRATKKLTFQSPVDVYAGIGSTTQQAVIDGATTTDQTVYHSVRPIIIDDWIGVNEVNLNFSDFNTSTGVISYVSDDQVGESKDVLIENGDAVSFYTPQGNTYPGGITTSRVFYVYNTSYNTGTGVTTVLPTSGITTVSFNISATWGSTTPFVPTSTGSVTYGKHRMLVSKSGRVESIATNDTITFTKPHGLQLNQQLIATWNTGSVKAVTRTRSNLVSNEYKYYYVKTIPSTTSITVSTKPGGGKANINNTTSAYNASAATPVAFIKVKDHPLANSFYLPPQTGFSTSPFVKGSYVFYKASGGTGFNKLGITTNTQYLLNPVSSSFPNWFRLHAKTNDKFDTYYNLTLSYTNAGNIYSGIHTFTATYEDPRNSSIRIVNPPRGEFSNNTEIQYDTDTGVLNIGGLVNGAIYRVKTQGESQMNFEDPGSNNRFRVANTRSATKVFAIIYSANKNYLDIYVNNTNVVGYGISTKGMIQLSGFDESQSFAAPWINGLHYVTGVTTSTKGTYKNKPRIRVDYPAHKNKNKAYSYPKNNTYIVNATVTGINSLTSQGGIGTHIVTLASDGAADDIYTISNAVDNTFTIDTKVEIPSVVKTITGGAIAGNVGVGSNWLRITNHNFADGTNVSYATTATEIGGLTSGDTYYIRVLDKNFVGLTSTQETALDRSDEDNPDLITFTGYGSTDPHSFSTNSVKGFLTGTGTIGVSTESSIITGVVTTSSTSTKFLTDFSIGDTFRIFKTVAGNTGPGTYFESKIVKINSDTVLKLEDIPDFQSSDAQYFVPTRFYALSDARITHRPFDGGVNMSAGLVPYTQTIRQSRKYFRYQSGKGIQCSMAINFNPTFDIDTISIDGVVGVSSTCIVKSKFPHGLSPNSIGSGQQVKISNAGGAYATDYNSIFNLTEIVDDYRFKFNTANVAPPTPPTGFPQFNIVGWEDAIVKAGMFDDQNGFFFKYDGTTLYAVRRSSTQQLSGTIAAETASNIFEGTDTRFTSQLTGGDRIVVRGQTYKVISVESDNILHVQPSYRGNNATNIVASYVSDTEVAQSNWNIDKCDGTGVTGYQIDINRIQMIYMDYSWYGAGKIRFGFKDQLGEVRYVHEFIHNNKFTESYFRSGNLPTRYEIETFDNPLLSPSLFHWGVSVIMDGRFDTDKSYLFTADSEPLPFTNGGIANNNGTRPVGTTTLNSNVIKAISGTEAGVLNVGEVVVSGTVFPANTKITAIEIDQDSEANKYSNKYQVTVSNAALSAGSKTLNVSSGTSDQLKGYIPLVSIRLAPSVDNGLIGNLGYRDIINRMQLTLKSAGVLTTHDCEAALFLNAQLSDDNFLQVGTPSLSQIYKHSVGDYFSGGTKIYSFRAQGGSVLNTTTGKRGLNASTIELEELALLGNAVIGGDRVYPDGPDVLTIAVKAIDTSQITGSAPMVVSARITWAEAQA